ERELATQGNADTAPAADFQVGRGTDGLYPFVVEIDQRKRQHAVAIAPVDRRRNADSGTQSPMRRVGRVVEY
ncbi:hypothetical protein IAI12_33020, partial [Escherichia coli]|uniref:hypothetical protein n=1 Tax=Escherichia coli TaxID=562 RepID=UPI0016554059